jgi:protein TonB
VTAARARSSLPWIYAGSLLLHVALGVILARLPTSERGRVVAIDFADVKKKAEAPVPPRTPPPAPREHRAKGAAAPQAAAPAKAIEAPAKESARTSGGDADRFIDLGAVALPGAGEGVPGGVGVPLGASHGGGDAAPKPTVHRVKQLAPTLQSDCTEVVVKPKVKMPGQVTYTKEAQEAEIEGVVRVQITVDETGHVIAASVLSGLGYGLDEVALTAARESLFEPATQCGKPVIGTRVVAFNFELR